MAARKDDDKTDETPAEEIDLTELNTRIAEEGAEATRASDK